MDKIVHLGEITCPSGELVLMDGGYLGLWSGEGDPADAPAHPGIEGADLEIVGPDAEAAGASFGRQSGRHLYDIPRHALDEMTAKFAAHCADHGLDASLRTFDRQVPHRERVRIAVAAGDPDFIISGVPVIPVGNIPADRALPVIAVPGEYGWKGITISLRTTPAAHTRDLGSIGVDWARFVFADADALSCWKHEETIDGLADVAFWGVDQERWPPNSVPPRPGRRARASTAG